MQAARLVLLALLTCFHWAPAEGVQVYDCQARGVTYEVVDLIATEECQNATGRFKPAVDWKTQVVYSEPDRNIKGLRCRVVLSKLVTTCRGMDHKIYGTMFTVWREPVDLSKAQCEAAMRDHVYTHLEKTTGRTHRIPITPGAVKGSHFFSHGSSNEHGYISCAENFVSGNVVMKHAYEQTLIEVLVEEIFGTTREDEGTVTFLGVKHVSRDHTLFDAVEGRITWNSSETNCMTSVSQAYLGRADVHQDATKEGMLGAIVMIRNVEEGQFAGLQLRAVKFHCTKKCYTTQIPGLVVCLFPDNVAVATNYRFRSGLVGDLQGPQTMSQLGYLHLDTNQRVQDRFDRMADHLCRQELVGWRAKMQALAGGDNPYALFDVYGRGHTIQVAGAVAYVTKCKPTPAIRADFPNCTMEIPVRVNGTLRFADPITWILKEFPTLVPCSPIMPVRWLIMGQWYCSSPGVQTCPPPQQFKSTVGLGEKEDFGRALGRGVFTQAQMDQHAVFWRAVHSRQAVVSKAANAAAGSGDSGSGGLGSLLSASDADHLLGKFRIDLFPILPSMAHVWSMLSGALLLISAVLMVIEAIYRMALIYLDRGCGPWVLLGVFNTLYTMFHVPQQVVRAAVAKLTANFDPLALPERLQQVAGAGNGPYAGPAMELRKLEEGRRTEEPRTAPPRPAPPRPEAPPADSESGTLRHRSEAAPAAPEFGVLRLDRYQDA